MSDAVPSNLKSLTNALADALIKHGKMVELASILADASADNLNSVGTTIRDNNSLMLGMCFFSDAVRKYDVGLFLAQLSGKTATDISAMDREAYRAAECFRRCGVACDLRDARGEIFNLSH